MARISSGSTFRSGANPTRDRSSGPSATGSRPSTRTDPEVGRLRPSTAYSRVVLPAPLAPTSPVTPAPTATSRLSRATAAPKRWVSAAVSTIDTGEP